MTHTPASELDFDETRKTAPGAIRMAVGDSVFDSSEYGCAIEGRVEWASPDTAIVLIILVKNEYDGLPVPGHHLLGRRIRYLYP